ncbi:endonuclease III [Candidatus Woesearchaeota archaeon]|nr:endonuclease III [Candidatus Woesearchaeota archaeon]
MKKIIEILRALEEQQQDESMLSQFGERSPFQILISTVLSARTKDTTTIPICKVLFAKYPDAKSLARADTKILHKILYGIGFYKVKSKRIKEISKILLEKYHGEVPKKLEELISLPGVGRKTANCVLVYAFRVPSIPVDVHVHRISNRLGWIKTKTPEETEQALMKLVPKEFWVEVNEHFVVHGQTICKPISPFCSKCPVSDYCKRIGVVSNR